MFKKVLIGCGLVTLLAMVILVGLAVYVTIKVKNFAEGYETAFTNLEQLEMEYQFEPLPEGEAIDPERLEAFFEIRGELINKIDSNPTIQKMLAAEPGEKIDVGQLELLSLATSFARELLELMHDELDAKQMAPGEYVYYTELVYAAIDKGKENGDPVLGGIYDDVESTIQIGNQFLDQLKDQGTDIDVQMNLDKLKMTHTEINDKDVETIKEHRAQLEKFPEIGILELALISALDEMRKKQPDFAKPRTEASSNAVPTRTEEDSQAEAEADQLDLVPTRQ